MKDLARQLMILGVDPLEADQIAAAVPALTDLYMAYRFAVSQWDSTTLETLRQDAVTGWWSDSAVSPVYRRLLTAQRMIRS